uniref:Uncharacterized protein n=1 Tax=Romanomermis culicivorax TaxID=13658 RepID=A0A915I5F2_ROMCU
MMLFVTLISIIHVAVDGFALDSTGNVTLDEYENSTSDKDQWKVTLSVFQKTQWNNTIKLVCKLHAYSSDKVEYELINQANEIIGHNDNGTFFFKLTDRYADFWC